MNSVSPDALIAAGALGGYQLTSGGFDTAVFVGAVCGPVIAASMMDGTWKARAARWLCSMLAGIGLTPAVLEWQEIDKPGIAMGCALAVAFSAWGLLKVAMEEGPRLFRRKAREVGK